MVKTVFQVEGMSCSHCTAALTRALGALKGVSEVRVELETKTAEVSYNPDLASSEELAAEIEAQGFGVKSLKHL